MDEEFLSRVNEVIETRRQEYRSWWDNLPEERKNVYQNLRVLGSDESEKGLNYHLYKCWQLLDIVDRLIDKDEKHVIPKGLSIHGSSPVVLVQIEGQEIPRHQSMNQIWQSEVPVGGVMTKFSKATFDTTPFGIKSEQPILFSESEIKSQDWTLEIGNS